MATKTLYIFLDESGDFNFSNTGSAFYTITAISSARDWDNLYCAMSNKLYDCIEYGNGMQYFHCCEDNSYVKNVIFDIIERDFQGKNIRIDSIIVEKRKTVPTLQKENEFYVMMLGYLLGYIFKNPMINNYDDIVIITDNLPINKRRKAVEKAIKKVLKEKLQNKKFRICHHNSCSHFMLQVTDYCSWAIFRKHERKDCDYYNKISKFIKSEFEIFSKGTTKHY